MRRSLLILATAALVAAGVVGVAPAYGLRSAGEALVLLLVLGGTALTIAHAVAHRRERLGGLGRQFNLGAALAVGQMLVAVVVVAALMFVTPEDALMIAAIVGFAGVIAVEAARMVTAGALHDVHAVRDGLVAVGQGARDVKITTTSDDELAQLAAAANIMVERLAAEEGARSDLVAAVSHDLRTPITSLRLLAEAIGDDIVDEATRRRYLETMTTHIHALSALIDDLFELSRLEAGDLEWSLEHVAVDELVDETVAALRLQAEARNVAVVADVPHGLAPAHANPEKVQRVLFNLIQNAIRHTPADGSVTVRAHPAAQEVEIEVADTGEGIDPLEQRRVFDPFYRGGSQAARTRAGAGLGLAISRAIVEAHGGRIWLEPTPREAGARVRFSLPIAT